MHRTEEFQELFWAFSGVMAGKLRCVEFRIPMPLSLEEYETGVTYAYLKGIAEERRRGGQAGVALLERTAFEHDEPADPRMEAGLYRRKRNEVRRKRTRRKRYFSLAHPCCQVWSTFAHGAERSGARGKPGRGGAVVGLLSLQEEHFPIRVHGRCLLFGSDPNDC